MSNYEDEYQKWVSSLSPKERAKLVAQGLDKPLVDDYKLGTPDSEVAFATIGEEFDYDQFDKDDDTERESELGKQYGCQMLRWVFERLQMAKNDKAKRLDIDTLMMALGMEQMLGVKTQTELAQKYGIARATVSARVKSWQKFLGLRPTSTMKSMSACQSYRRSRLKILTNT